MLPPPAPALDFARPTDRATTMDAALTRPTLIPIDAHVSDAAGDTASAGNSAILGGGRQLLIVVPASAVTYGIGSLFGTAVA